MVWGPWTPSVRHFNTALDEFNTQSSLFLPLPPSPHAPFFMMKLKLKVVKGLL